MPTTMTRFEVVLSDGNITDAQQAAVDTFLVTIKGLTDYVYYPAASSSGLPHKIINGYITVAQQAAALGFLNTLDAAMGANVICAIWTVTLEP